MFIIYDLIFLCIAVIYLPVYLLRRKFHRGLLARLGILAEDLKFDRPIWVHAVSVGEAMALRGLIRKLCDAYPDKKIVISTVTVTGNRIAKSIARECDFVTYLPLDFSAIVRRVINKINPALFIIAETEIWPNLILYLYNRNIPIAVVNGRISDSSFKGYSLIKFLLKPVLARVSLFCMQTERDAHRLCQLGVEANKVKVTGNMKFDTDLKKMGLFKDSVCSDLRQKLRLHPQEKVFIAASTHPKEEGIVLNVYKKLIAELDNLRLLIVPRHPERSSEVANLVKKFGFSPVRISVLDSGTPDSSAPELGVLELSGPRAIFILDTVGQLVDYYTIADVVFVGGSFIKKGGHNILEPAALDKPVIFGPYMFNFRDIAELFLLNKCAILVHNEEEFARQVKYLFDKPEESREFSRRAKELILKNQGATQKNLQLIQNLHARVSL